MFIKVSSPGKDLKTADIDAIEKDLEKIDRRLADFDEVNTEVRVNGMDGAPGFAVVLEVDYGRNHLMGKAENPDLGVAVREAREEVLRQINDRSRRGHSWFKKR